MCRSREGGHVIQTFPQGSAFAFPSGVQFSRPMTDDSAAPPKGFWAVARQAVRGEHRHDYTEGAIGRSILLLAIPMVLEMVMESVFAVVDVFFVARLGPDAVAVVGMTESMMALVYSLAMGIAIGATAMVARRIGEQDPEGAAHAGAQALILATLIAAVLGTLGIIFGPALLAAVGASDAVVAMGRDFVRVQLGANLVIMLLFVGNAIFRAAGDAALAMRVLWFANAINIVLAPSLIYGVGPLPEMGVTGAAVGTTIGRGAGALFALWMLVRPGRRVMLRARHFHPDPPLMWRLIQLASSATFQMIIGTASWVLLIRILSRFGSAAVAGYTIGIRVIIFALLPSWGLSNAAATMVGQALGAKKPDRAERAVWIAGHYNALFLGVIGLAFVLLADPITRIFTDDPLVSGYARDALRIIAAGFIF